MTYYRLKPYLLLNWPKFWAIILSGNYRAKEPLKFI